jgi:hypothetical protein
LASITKLNIEFLNALENGRWDLLPGSVYLKPFTKTCAEALDLDTKELYSIINGVRGEEKPFVPTALEPSAGKRKIDYKLPIVATAVLIIIAVISVILKSDRFNSETVRKSAATAVKSPKKTDEIKWEKPWQRPPANYGFYNSQRLRLEASGSVWACIIADGDTVFAGTLRPGASRTFIAEEKFKITLNRNDHAKGYLNGSILPAIGTGPERLRNYLIEPVRKETTSKNEG